MRAARYHGRKDVRIEDVPIPLPGSGECLIEVEWCGICGTDIHEYVAGMISLIADSVCVPQGPITGRG